MSKTIKLLEDGYIPTSQYAAMWGGLYPDLSSYATQAHIDAGVGGEVLYPNGNSYYADPLSGSNIVAGTIVGSPIIGAKSGNTYNGKTLND